MNEYRWKRLTVAESKLFNRHIRGMKIAEIADDLGLAYTTERNLLGHLRNKFNAKTNGQMVAIVIMHEFDIRLPKVFDYPLLF